MATFQLLPGARGLDLADGRSIRADKRGRVTVPDDMAASIKNSTAFRHYDALMELAPGRYAGGANDYVHDCGFVPWPWQRVCARCGSTLEDR